MSKSTATQLEMPAAPAVVLSQPATPTAAQWAAYEGMYQYFNTTLFKGQLPPVVLNFSRWRRSLGFFAPHRWAGVGNAKDRRHEISINPHHLATHTADNVASTLVHEMAHLWQAEFGAMKSRSGYHNQEWARVMLTIGLQPTDDGTPNGRMTGQHMGHLIIKDGAFARAWAVMPEELRLPFACVVDDEGGQKKPGNGKGKKDEGGDSGGGGSSGGTKSRNKTKYGCSGGCGVNVWGRPNLNLTCGDCDEPFVAEGE